MSVVTGAQYRAELAEWDGLTFSVSVDIPAERAHGADVEVPELVQMSLSRLIQFVRSSRAAIERRDAELVAEQAACCPATHVVLGDDDQAHGIACTLPAKHAEHHRGGGIAWLATIDPWAQPLPDAVSDQAPF